MHRQSRMGVVKGWEERDRGVLLKRVQEISGGDGCTTMWMHLCLWTVLLKMVKTVNFVMFYHNKKVYRYIQKYTQTYIYMYNSGFTDEMETVLRPEDYSPQLADSQSSAVISSVPRCCGKKRSPWRSVRRAPGSQLCLRQSSSSLTCGSTGMIWRNVSTAWRFSKPLSKPPSLCYRR